MTDRPTDARALREPSEEERIKPLYQDALHWFEEEIYELEQDVGIFSGMGDERKIVLHILRDGLECSEQNCIDLATKLVKEGVI